MTMTRSLSALAVFAALAATAARPAYADPAADFSFELREQTKEHHRAWVMDKLVTLKLGKACWAKAVDKKQRALHIAGFVTRDIAELAKAMTGNDWSKIEGQTANSKEENRKLVEKMVDDFRDKLHVTVSVEGDNCDASGNALWLKYWAETARALKAYPPKAGKAVVTINVTAKAKGVTAEVGGDGASFTITASRDVEEAGWDGKIQKAFKRVSSKQ